LVQNDALLPSTNLDGELYIEYVKDRGDSSDIPFAEIVQAFNDFYGSDLVPYRLFSAQKNKKNYQQKMSCKSTYL